MLPGCAGQPCKAWMWKPIALRTVGCSTTPSDAPCLCQKSHIQHYEKQGWTFLSQICLGTAILNGAQDVAEPLWEQRERGILVRLSPAIRKTQTGEDLLVIRGFGRLNRRPLQMQFSSAAVEGNLIRPEKAQS